MIVTVMLVVLAGCTSTDPALVDPVESPVAAPKEAAVLPVKTQPERIKGDALSPLSESDLVSLSGQYFRIREWDNAIKYLTEFVDRFAEARWPSVIEVEIDTEASTVGGEYSGEEFETRYRLGKAYLERFKIDLNTGDLKKAALHLRRCYNFTLISGAIGICHLNIRVIYRTQTELYYLDLHDDLAEVYTLLHDRNVRVDWPKYQDQYNKKLSISGEQWSPTTRRDHLLAAIKIHWHVWISFRMLDSYQYRTEFREHYLAWLRLIVKHKRVYGAGSEEYRKFYSSARESAKLEQEFIASYRNQKTKEFITEVNRLRQLLKP